MEVGFHLEKACNHLGLIDFAGLLSSDIKLLGANDVGLRVRDDLCNAVRVKGGDPSRSRGPAMMLT